jgi:hypothetical protein
MGVLGLRSCICSTSGSSIQVVTAVLEYAPQIFADNATGSGTLLDFVNFIFSRLYHRKVVILAGATDVLVK